MTKKITMKPLLLAVVAAFGLAISSSAQSANAGTYTVVIGLASGDYVVSSPLVIALGTPGGSSSSSSGGSSSSSSGASPAAATTGGGGGGAPSVWYLALIGALAFARARKKLTR